MLLRQVVIYHMVLNSNPISLNLPFKRFKISLIESYLLVDLGSHVRGVRIMID